MPQDICHLISQLGLELGLAASAGPSAAREARPGLGQFTDFFLQLQDVPVWIPAKPERRHIGLRGLLKPVS